MKKVLNALFAIIILFSSCSSGDNNEEPTAKDEYNVELSDLYGTWVVSESSQENLRGIKLVLKRLETCTWTDQKGNDFVGPYYFLENVNDEILRGIGNKLSADKLDRIHLGQVKVINYITEQVSTLLLDCDLYPFLPNRNWSDFTEKVDYEEWRFWGFNTFRYEFDITKYSERRLELLLTTSDIRYCDYPERYPLRIPNNTKIVLKRE